MSKESGRIPSWHASSAIGLCVLLAVGCGKKDEPQQAAPAASATASAAPPVNPMTWRCVIDPKSSAHVDVPAGDRHVEGDTSTAMGTLQISGRDLAQSRGSVMFDLSTFSIGGTDGGEDSAQTARARGLLDVLASSPKAQTVRWASLAISSIDELSATDLSKIAPSQDGSDQVRSVTMTVHGDVLLHGHKLAADCPVEVSFRYPQGAAADAQPMRVEIKSKKPMRVALDQAAVRARSAAGKAAPYADVTVTLTATPTP